MNDPRPQQPLLGRVLLAGAQLALIAALLTFFFTAESDATATTVDWRFVTFMIVMPSALAASYLAGRSLSATKSASQPIVMRLFVRTAQAATLALLLPALVVAPLAILGAIIFGPMG